jgi:GT2 family glycosyltransferase
MLSTIKAIFIKTVYIFKSKGFFSGIITILKKITLKFFKHKVSSYFRGNRYKAFLSREKDYIHETFGVSLQEIAEFQLLPTFSIIMPVYNVKEIWLRKAIESVTSQIYPKWELCIADDASPSPHIRTVLLDYAKTDPRIKVIFRDKNGGISAASNSALELATGEYIALLDNDDELSLNALLENARLINLHPEADLIYSDEDKINEVGKRFDAFFKPNWSPDYFHGCMYLGHLCVYRTSIILKAGKFRGEYDGSQDYDLALRVTDITKNIFYIPKILYHWRTLSGSAAFSPYAKLYAFKAAQKALEDMLKRKSIVGEVEANSELLGCFRVRFKILDIPLISIIIPSAGKVINTAKGKKCLLEKCITSLINITAYKNFEIIIVDGFDIGENYLNGFVIHQNIRLVRSSETFNFSQRINLGASSANGDFLLLLNDDVEITNPDWLSSMLEICQLKEVGAVGAKLLYPNKKLQHVGIIFPDGLPGHTFNGFEGDYTGYFNSTILNKNFLAVTAACLMVSKSNFDNVNGFEEELPLAYNDVDFCLKLHKAGYRNVFTPYAQLMHHESATRQKTPDFYAIDYLKRNWSDYLKSIGNDPYYHPNFSKLSFNFELP